MNKKPRILWNQWRQRWIFPEWGWSFSQEYAYKFTRALNIANGRQI